MKNLIRLSEALIVLSTVYLVVGCGGGPPLQKVKGQVLVNGQNYPVGEKELLQVVFYPDSSGQPISTTYPAMPNKDGSYELAGTDGRGIPAGKYRVGITSPYGGGTVKINPQFATQQSPIIREVVIGKDTVDPIDIAKPSG